MTTYITNIGLLATPGDSARRGRQQGRSPCCGTPGWPWRAEKSPPWGRDSLPRRTATPFWTPEGG
ncbi:MAG: hypothetical protein ACLR5H_06300 [Oscillospiraceae bacterium]